MRDMIENQLAEYEVKELYNEATMILGKAFGVSAVDLYIESDVDANYYGLCHRSGNKFTGITINLFPFRFAQEGEKAYDKIKKFGWDIKDCVLETICHELAHLTYWSHSPLHKKLTSLYYNKVQQARKGENLAVAQTRSDIYTLKDLCELIELDPRKARSILRKNNIEKPGKQWEWEQGMPKDIYDLLINLKVRGRR
ncbi:hypothetical protein CPAS15_0002 [Clostridium phage CPAS-15]|uniref:hypothetical protein n=1 Tax=Enterococcus faecium TaxID=1352 RepID=UPI001462ADE9|nr:hypothetical protein [Enterococcus faecium]QGF20053.1 hypothetical protein CPAS15_0002 [Clostridium phage CPAS-15]